MGLANIEGYEIPSSLQNIAKNNSILITAQDWNTFNNNLNLLKSWRQKVSDKDSSVITTTIDNADTNKNSNDPITAETFNKTKKLIYGLAGKSQPTDIQRDDIIYASLFTDLTSKYSDLDVTASYTSSTSNTNQETGITTTITTYYEATFPNNYIVVKTETTYS